MLEIKNLSVYYDKLAALKDVSLSVEAGEVVAIIGSNGAGKSTLLKTISGLVAPRSGSITFQGQRIDGQDADSIVEKGIAHVPEGRRLFPFLSVEENLKVGSYPRRARADRHSTMLSIFEMFPALSGRQHQSAETLSGGEQQMVAVGRGLMSKPSLLMLDEPSQGLAPAVVTRLYNAIKQLNEKGLTILLVEQNTQYALNLADRAYVLETGNIILSGKGEELLDHEHVKKSYMGL